MFSKISLKLSVVFFMVMSFSLIAGEVKSSNKVAIKTKQGKTVTTKDGTPVYIKKK